MESQESAAASDPHFVSIRNLPKKDLLALPSVDCVVTKSTRTDKRTKTVSDNYSVDVVYDFVTKFHATLTGNQYGLLVTIMPDKFVPEQFRCRAKVRITKFGWGKNDRGDDRSSYLVEIFFSPLLSLSYKLQANDPFVTLLELRVQKGAIDASLAPVSVDGSAIRDAGFDEELLKSFDSDPLADPAK